MARWEDKDFEGEVDEKSEEIHLLKKFQEYLNLEKNELEKKGPHYIYSKNTKLVKNQNLALAVVEGTILIGLTAAFLFLWKSRHFLSHSNPRYSTNCRLTFS